MTFSPDPFAPQFFSTDVARATGVSLATLKNWISRDPPAVLMSDADRQSSTSGRSHLFTFNRIMQVALTAELVRLGIGPRRAGLLAATFTDTDIGSRPAGPRAEAMPRTPGQLFSEGATVLIAYDGEDVASIVNMLPDTPMQSLFFPHGRRTKRADAAALVWVDMVHARVSRALRQGLPDDETPARTLEAARGPAGSEGNLKQPVGALVHE